MWYVNGMHIKMQIGYILYILFIGYILYIYHLYLFVWLHDKAACYCIDTVGTNWTIIFVSDEMLFTYPTVTVTYSP